MKSAIISITAGMFWLGGCAAPARTIETARTESVQPAGDKVRGAAGRQVGKSVSRKGQETKEMPSMAIAPPADIPPPPEPDVVIKLAPGTDVFSGEMEARLATVAEQARTDDRIIIRLESYVPDGGSPALNIGIADRVLHKVKERLQALGVPPRRILLASFGAEHRKERDPHRHWVDVYILRPSY